MGETDLNRQRARRDLHVRGVGDFVLQDLSFEAERRLWPFLRRWPHVPTYGACVDEFISAVVVEPVLTPEDVGAFPMRVRQQLRLAALDIVGAARDYRRLRGSHLSMDERAFASLYWRRERQLEDGQAIIDRLRARRAKNIAEMPTLSPKAERAAQLMLHRHRKSFVGLLDQKRSPLNLLSKGFESPWTKTLDFRSTLDLASGVGTRPEITTLTGMGRKNISIAALDRGNGIRRMVQGFGATDDVRRMVQGIGAGDELRRAVQGAGARGSLSESVLALAGHPTGRSFADAVAGFDRGAFRVPAISTTIGADLRRYGTVDRLGARAALMNASAVALRGLGTDHLQEARRAILATARPDLGTLGMAGFVRGLGDDAMFASDDIPYEPGVDVVALEDDVIDDVELDEAFQLIAWLTLARTRSAEWARDARVAGGRALDIGGQWVWKHPLGRLADYREVAPYLTAPQRNVIKGGFVGAAILIARAFGESMDGFTVSNALTWAEAAAALQGTYFAIDVWRDEADRR